MGERIKNRSPQEISNRIQYEKQRRGLDRQPHHSKTCRKDKRHQHRAHERSNNFSHHPAHEKISHHPTRGIREERERKQQIETWQPPATGDDRSEHDAAEQYEQHSPHNISAQDAECSVHPPLSEPDSRKHTNTGHTESNRADGYGSREGRNTLG